MDEMREIVTLEQANSLFLWIAIAAPIIGILVGAGVGARRGNTGRASVRGFVIGLLGPANLVLWNIYNLITDRLGLDTVKNLLVNLSLFVALGIIAGIIAGRYYRARIPESVDSAAVLSKPAADYATTEPTIETQK